MLVAYLIVACAFAIWTLVTLHNYHLRRLDRVDRVIACCLSVGCGLAWPLMLVVGLAILTCRSIRR